MRNHLIHACRPAQATLALGSALMLAPAAVADTFQPREGCTHVVTIQSEGCYVRNVVTCPEMGPGPLVYAVGKDGKLVATAFDADGATMFSGPQDAGMLLKDRTDLFSLAALKSSGTDSYDYTMAGRDGAEVRFTGTATLTGETIQIDGRDLSVISTLQEVTPPGAAAIKSEITALYDEELSLVLTAEARDVDSGKVTLQRPPAEFLFPGEDGALAAEPRIGCEG
jgi:hypothetical protein